MSDNIDFDLLCRTKYCLTNRDIYGKEFGLALGYLFKTNYFFSEVANHLNKTKLINILQLFPEIKNNFDELIEIEKKQQNGAWFSRTIINDLTNIVQEINITQSEIEYPKEVNLSKLVLLGKARSWFQNGEVGASSRSICLGAIFDELYLLEDTPWDADDMKRCIKLVQYIPELKDHLDILINHPDIKLKWKTILINVKNEHNHFIKHHE